MKRNFIADCEYYKVRECSWVSLCVSVCLWVSLSVFGCQGVSENLWVSFGVLECLLLSLSVFGCPWVSFSVSEVLWVFLGVPECLLVSLSVSECRCVSLSVSECLWVSLDVPELIWYWKCVFFKNLEIFTFHRIWTTVYQKSLQIVSLMFSKKAFGICAFVLLICIPNSFLRLGLEVPSFLLNGMPSLLSSGHLQDELEICSPFIRLTRYHRQWMELQPYKKNSWNHQNSQLVSLSLPLDFYHSWFQTDKHSIFQLTSLCQQPLKNPSKHYHKQFANSMGHFNDRKNITYNLIEFRKVLLIIGSTKLCDNLKS